MKKMMIVLAGLFMVVLAGCSDDECLTCPQSEEPASFWSHGEIICNKYPDLHFLAHFWSNGSTYGMIDSVKFGDTDSLCWLQDYSWAENIADYYYTAWWTDRPHPYEPGDTAEITVYGDGQSSICNVVLLDYQDTASFISPEDDTLVTIGDSVTCVWNSVENAAWYGLYILNSSRDEIYTYSLDTSFSLLPDLFEGSFDVLVVQVVPVSGPVPPSSEGNWIGNYVTGNIYSYAIRQQIIINYGPAPSPGKSAAGVDIELPERTPAEIIDAIYKVYK